MHSKKKEVVTAELARHFTNWGQGGISRGGGEREIFHGAVTPAERDLNVFNIT